MCSGSLPLSFFWLLHLSFVVQYYFFLLCSSENGKSGDADKRMKRCSSRSKSFNVEISYATKIPLKSIALALQGAEIENTQDALRVLDIILRQKAAKMYTLTASLLFEYTLISQI